MAGSGERASRRPRLSSHLLRTAGFAVLPAALVAAGVLVSTSSYAAFNAKTTNPTDQWTAGTVVLQHDAAAPAGNGVYSTGTAALFPAGTTSGAGGLQPGGSVTRCTDVQSTGSLASGEVRLYASAPSGAIASGITLTVAQGTAASTCSGTFSTAATLFSGSLDTFATSTTGKDYATGYSTGWTPTAGGNEVRAFRFTATLDSGVISSVQGTSATTNLFWETQSD